MKKEVSTPIVVPGNVPGAYQEILGPAPTDAQKATAEVNAEMMKADYWTKVWHFGACGECMQPTPECRCDDF